MTSLETNQEEQETANEFKAFDLYALSDIRVEDPALRPYFNFSQRILLKSHGRARARFAKTKLSVVERLAGRLGVPGHVGKKHKLITSWSSGKYNRNMKTVLETLGIIQKRTNKNPIQVIVTAIENASPRDEITVIEHAGARYPQAVDVSPVRRIDLALRWFVIGAYSKSFGKKKKIAETLANEIILAFQNNGESYAVTKKNEAEKQADSAR